MRRLLVIGVLTLATACGTPSLSAAHVSVDTPQLRALKASAGIATCSAVASSAKPSGRVLPTASLPCLGGGPSVEVANLRGPLVINLWAQWCGPCRKELPFYEQFFKNGNKVLGIDWNDTQPSLALQLAKDRGVTYPLVADEEPAIRGQFLPRLILIDAAGSVAYDEAIQIHSLAQLEGLVATHLGQAAVRR